MDPKATAGEVAVSLLAPLHGDEAAGQATPEQALVEEAVGVIKGLVGTLGRVGGGHGGHPSASGFLFRTIQIFRRSGAEGQGRRRCHVLGLELP